MINVHVTKHVQTLPSSLVLNASLDVSALAVPMTTVMLVYPSTSAIVFIRKSLNRLVQQKTTITFHVVLLIFEDIYIYKKDIHMNTNMFII